MNESRVFLFSTTKPKPPPGPCPGCGNALIEAPQPNGLYRYTACGLDDVLLDVAGATPYDCTACDDGAVSVRAMGDLHRVIVQDRLRITLLRSLRDDERTFLQNYVLCAADPDDATALERIADGGLGLRLAAARVVLGDALHSAADDMEREREHRRRAQRAGADHLPFDRQRWRAAGSLHAYLSERPDPFHG
jgi:hypothetical protein